MSSVLSREGEANRTLFLMRGVFFNETGDSVGLCTARGKVVPSLLSVLEVEELSRLLLSVTSRSVDEMERMDVSRSIQV